MIKQGEMRVLAVIPARGGSKGIPRKNLRLMHGKPLIAYAIQNALSCPIITDCVVSTDDDEIASVAQLYGSQVVFRDPELAKDAVTLDPVIYDAVGQMEQNKGIHYDVVVTLQPTSPLMTSETLNRAMQVFFMGHNDTMISVVNKPHLSWVKKNNRIVPNYKTRLNRQQLPPNYSETGAFFITKREFVVENSRLGNNIGVYEVPAQEATDIDSVDDWIVAESVLNKKNIIFRVDGMKSIGLGHIYNCITMAFDMMGHNVLFVTRKDCVEGLKKIRSTNMPYVTIDSDTDIESIIDRFKPDIWVNDCLNTTEETMKWLKAKVPRVVSIEDVGPGTKYADAVINALYEGKATLCKHTYEGSDYICLRNEFLIEKPKEFSEHVGHIMVMFGGTDPSNLNSKLYKAAENITADYPELVFDFVTGIGYDAEGHGIISNSEKRIYVHNDVSKVTDFMRIADLAITSQGRTVFEIASMGVPAVILAQNQRELQHIFATMKNGFINLGLGENVSVEAVINTLRWLIDTPNIRYNMHELMLKSNLRKSHKKVKNIILGEENDY